MKKYQSQSHDTFRSTLLNDLKSMYPSHYFSVNVYNSISGNDNHAVKGYSYAHIFREYGRNVVVTYTKKSSTVPSSSMRTTIKDGVLDEIIKEVSL